MRTKGQEVPERTMRHRVRAGVLAGAAILSLGACGESDTVRAEGGTPPNVVLIVMDTTRGDRCGFTGYDRPTTPELDAFAKGATVYRNAWAQSPWTAPSHASLFTGLVTERHGLLSGIRTFLGDDSYTMAEILRDAGYGTAAYVNNPYVGAPNGLLQGFDTVQHMFERKDTGYPSAPKTHDLAGAWVAGQRAAGKPFFLFINHFEPHLAYEPTYEMQSKFMRSKHTNLEIEKARRFSFPACLGVNIGVEKLTPTRREIISDLYDAEIADLDREMGRFLKRLKDDGVLDDTIVVIAGDHGENLGEHGLTDHMFSLHRTLLHVPLMVRFPGKFSMGAKVDEVVRLVDVLPTVAELAGLRLPEGLDGQSLSGDVKGRTSSAALGMPQGLIEAAAQQFPDVPMNRLRRSGRSITDARHHLVEWSDGKQFLYDYVKDPLENKNLAPTDTATLERMRALLGSGVRGAAGLSGSAGNNGPRSGASDSVK